MKKYLLFQYFFIINLLIICSCHSNDETHKKLYEFQNSKIDFPDYIANQFNIEKDYYFIISLDNSDCVPCSLKNIAMLNYYNDDFDKFKTEVMLIINGVVNDDREFINDLFSELGISYRAIFDEESLFLKRNPSVSNPILNMFIVNKESKVVWIGSPIHTEKSLKQYRKMMSILVKKKSK